MVCVTHSGIRLCAPAPSAATSRRMNSLGSCCRLFRQTLLAANSHCAGLQAQSRRAYALPRAALSRSRQAKQEAVTSDNVAENKVPGAPATASCAAHVTVRRRCRMSALCQFHCLLVANFRGSCRQKPWNRS